MSDKYTREILRRNVAQICQTIGWHSINSTPLDILVHVLEKYILSLGTQAHRYAEQFNRTDPNLHDLGLVFRDLHVHLPELVDYTKCVPPVPSTITIEKFPKPKESNLNFLKPGSNEVVTRPVHVHEHLPAMYPEKEKETAPPVADTVEIRQNGHIISENSVSNKSPEISVTDSPEKQKDPFKRPIDPVGILSSKRPRLRLDDEDCHTREISSVMMTMSGFLSPAREGKLPEAKTPVIAPERHVEKAKGNLHPATSISQSPHVPHEKADRKSKKGKLVNGKVMKNKKKDKSHKSDSGKRNNSSKSDKVSSNLVSKHRDVPSLPVHNHIAGATTPVRPLPAALPSIETVRPIKTEPVSAPEERHNSAPPAEPKPVAPTYPTPVPIPRAQSTLLPRPPPPLPISNHTHPAPPVPKPIPIKVENIENEKLASQPDRSKLNIFKRISSNKLKEDKNSTNPDLGMDRSISENVIPRPEKIPVSVTKADKQHLPEPSTKFKQSQPIPQINNEMPAMNLSSRTLDLTTNEVINIDDDSGDTKPVFNRHESPSNAIPNNNAKTKPIMQKDDMFNALTKEQKKEKKRKERKEKAERALKDSVNLYKKRHSSQSTSMPAERFDVNFPPMKSPKLGRPPKNESKSHSNMPPSFPFFPIPSGLQPGRGLIPGPGLIPNLSSGDLFSGFANNPALRGILPPPHSPGMINPFSLSPGGPGLIPGPSYLHGSPLMPHNISNPMMSLGHFGQPSRASQPQNIHSFLPRRPSLEVIPVDNDEVSKNQKATTISPVPSRDKDKYDKHKIPSIPNILQKHNVHKNRSLKESSPKSNPMIQMPPIHPDITIQLNPPAPKVDTKDEVHIVDDEPPPPPPKPVAPPPTVDALPKDKDRDKVERKKDKLHKKDKKEKDIVKIKKKKDKKDKNKLKLEKRKEREEKHELKEKLKKEKKEKRREKEKPAPPPLENIVPKLTLKLGSSSPMPPSSPEVPFKLNIKPVVKKDDAAALSSSNSKNDRLSPDPSQSPELAQISALVTRPPKSKSSSKNSSLNSDQLFDLPKSDSPSPKASNTSPTRKNRPPSSYSKYKRIYFKPVTKKGGNGEEINDGVLESDRDEHIPKPTVVREAPSALQLSEPFYTDSEGNKVWVCPACGRPDNGTPMIGCDGCDGWYHWICVGITVDPGASDDWFCKSCIAKRTAMATALAGGQTGKKRGRKPKADKLRDAH